MSQPEASHEENPTIDVAPGGPYRTRGIEDLRNSRGERVESKPLMALCRCGQSAKKPFCDGTHKGIAFSGTNESDPAKRKTREYVGSAITIQDRRWICYHAAECIHGLPEVWRKDGRPWIEPDAGSVERVVEVVLRCPSGALSYTILGLEAPTTTAVHAPRIEIEKNGPYRVTGAPVLKDPGGLEPPVAERYALCRCGQSKNKPFCDGSHTAANFVDDGN